MISSQTALLLIDLQNDFCPGGSLAVPEGDQVIAAANQLMPHFKTVIATQDWHPRHHASFVDLWPVHCVQNTFGAQFHPDLQLHFITTVIQKGIDQMIDSYSAFYDNAHVKNTGLADYLRKKNISVLYVMGLATDYCVKYSCLDAITEGFTVHLIQDGCRGVNLQKHDIENALRTLEDSGVMLTTIKDTLKI